MRITITTGKVIKIVQNVPYQGPTFDPAFNRYVVTYSATAVGLLTIDIQSKWSPNLSKERLSVPSSDLACTFFEKRS